MQSFPELILPFAPPEVEGAADESLVGLKDRDSVVYDEEDALMNGKSLHLLKADQGKTIMPPAHQSSCWSEHGQPIAPPDRLSNFYRRYNKVLLDSIAIDKEKERLRLENAQLQDLVQQFIDGTQLSETVLSEDNPLFVVNGRANLNNAPPVRAMNPTVQEACLISNSTSRQMRGMR